jgi:hypothetical protein
MGYSAKRFKAALIALLAIVIVVNSGQRSGIWARRHVDDASMPTARSFLAVAVRSTHRICGTATTYRASRASGCRGSGRTTFGTPMRRT